MQPTPDPALNVIDIVNLLADIVIFVIIGLINQFNISTHFISLSFILKLINIPGYKLNRAHDSVLFQLIGLSGIIDRIEWSNIQIYWKNYAGNKGGLFIDVFGLDIDVKCSISSASTLSERFLSSQMRHVDAADTVSSSQWWIVPVKFVYSYLPSPKCIQVRLLSNPLQTPDVCNSSCKINLWTAASASAGAGEAAEECVLRVHINHVVALCSGLQNNAYNANGRSAHNGIDSGADRTSEHRVQCSFRFDSFGILLSGSSAGEEAGRSTSAPVDQSLMASAMLWAEGFKWSADMSRKNNDIAYFNTSATMSSVRLSTASRHSSVYIHLLSQLLFVSNSTCCSSSGGISSHPSGGRNEVSVSELLEETEEYSAEKFDFFLEHILNKSDTVEAASDNNSNKSSSSIHVPTVGSSLSEYPWWVSVQLQLRQLLTATAVDCKPGSISVRIDDLILLKDDEKHQSQPGYCQREWLQCRGLHTTCTLAYPDAAAAMQSSSACNLCITAGLESIGIPTAAAIRSSDHHAVGIICKAVCRIADSDAGDSSCVTMDQQLMINVFQCGSLDGTANGIASVDTAMPTVSQLQLSLPLFDISDALPFICDLLAVSRCLQATARSNSTWIKMCSSPLSKPSPAATEAAGLNRSGLNMHRAALEEKSVEFTLSLFKVSLSSSSDDDDVVVDGDASVDRNRNCFSLALLLDHSPSTATTSGYHQSSSSSFVPPQHPKALVIQVQNIRGQVRHSSSAHSGADRSSTAMVTVDAVTCLFSDSGDGSECGRVSIAPLLSTSSTSDSLGANSIDAATLVQWAVQSRNKIAFYVADISLSALLLCQHHPLRRYSQEGRGSSIRLGMNMTAAQWSRCMDQHAAAEEETTNAERAVHLSVVIGALLSPCLSMEVVGTLAGVIHKFTSALPRNNLATGQTANIVYDSGVRLFPSDSSPQNIIGDIMLTPRFRRACGRVTVKHVDIMLNMAMRYTRSSAATPLLKPRVTSGGVDETAWDRSEGPEKILSFHLLWANGFVVEGCSLGRGLAHRLSLCGGSGSTVDDSVSSSILLQYSEELKETSGSSFSPSLPADTAAHATTFNLLRIDLPVNEPFYTTITYTDNFLLSSHGDQLGTMRSYSAAVLESMDVLFDVKFVEVLAFMCGECSRFQLPFSVGTCHQEFHQDTASNPSKSQVLVQLAHVHCALTGCSMFEQPACMSGLVIRHSCYQFSCNDGELVCRLATEQMEIHSSVHTNFDQSSGIGLLYDTVTQASGCISGLLLQDLSCADAKHVDVISTVHNSAAVKAMLCEEEETEGDGRVYADDSDASDCDFTDSDSSCDSDSADETAGPEDDVNVEKASNNRCGCRLNGSTSVNARARGSTYSDNGTNRKEKEKGSYIEFHLTSPSNSRQGQSQSQLQAETHPYRQSHMLPSDSFEIPVLSPVLEIRACDLRVLYLQRSLFTLISYFRDHVVADWYMCVEEVVDAVSSAVEELMHDNGVTSTASGCLDGAGIGSHSDKAPFLRWSVQLFNSELHLPCSSAGCDALVAIIQKAQIFQQVTLSGENAAHVVHGGGVHLHALNRFCKGPAIVSAGHMWLSDLLVMKRVWREFTKSSSSGASYSDDCLLSLNDRFDWNLGGLLSESEHFVSPPGLTNPALGTCILVKLTDAALCTWCSSNLIGDSVSLDVRICPATTSVAEAAKDAGTDKNASAKAPLFNSQVEINVATAPLRWKLSQGQYQAVVHIIQQNVCELTSVVPDLFAADAKIRYSDDSVCPSSSDLPQPGVSIIPPFCPIFSYVRLHLPLAELTLMENNADYFKRYLSMLSHPVWSARLDQHNAGGYDNLQRCLSKCDLDSVPIWASHYFYSRKLFIAADSIRYELEGEVEGDSNCYHDRDANCVSSGGTREGSIGGTKTVQGSRSTDIHLGGDVEFSVRGDETMTAIVLIDRLELEIYQMHGSEGNGIELTARSLLALSPTKPSDLLNSDDTRHILHSTPIADRLPCTPGDGDTCGHDGTDEDEDDDSTGLSDVDDDADSATSDASTDIIGYDDHYSTSDRLVTSSASYWTSVVNAEAHPQEFYDSQFDSSFEYFYYAPQLPPESAVDSAAEEELIGMRPSLSATNLSGTTASAVNIAPSATPVSIDSATEEELVGMTPSVVTTGSATNLAFMKSEHVPFPDVPDSGVEMSKDKGMSENTAATGKRRRRSMSAFVRRVLDHCSADRIILGPSWLPHLSPTLYASWQEAGIRGDNGPGEPHYFSNRAGLRLFRAGNHCRSDLDSKTGAEKSSFSEPQVHFSLQFNADCYRRAIVDLSDTYISAQLEPISALVAYFADPVQLSTQRMYEVQKFCSGSWFDYCVQFGLYVRARNSVICLSNTSNDGKTRATVSKNRIKSVNSSGLGGHFGSVNAGQSPRRVPHVLCIHTDLGYAHSWHGLQFIGPALVESSLTLSVHSVYIAALTEIQHSHIASLFANYSPSEGTSAPPGITASLSLQYTVVPPASSFDQNVSTCAPVIDSSAEWLVAKRPVVSVLANSRRDAAVNSTSPLANAATGSMSAKITVGPSDRSVKSQSNDASTCSRTVSEGSLAMICRASVTDIFFLGGVLASLQATSTSLMQENLRMVKLADRYQCYLGGYSDCKHLPLLTYWMSRHVCLSPATVVVEQQGLKQEEQEVIEEDEVLHGNQGEGLQMQPSADNIRLTISVALFSHDFHLLLRNHTYNLDILRLELSSIRFLYSVFEGDILMETSVDAVAFVLNDSVNRFNTARCIDYGAVEANKSASAGYWEPVLEQMHFEGCATSDGNTSAGDPLRLNVQVESSPLDTTLSYSLLSVLLRKLSLADVVTSLSAQLPPYRIINACGLAVEAKLSIGKHILATEAVAVNSTVGIDMQRLSSNTSTTGRTAPSASDVMNPFLKEIIMSKQCHSLSISLASGECFFVSKDALPVDHECSYERFEMCPQQAQRCAPESSGSAVRKSVGNGEVQVVPLLDTPTVYMSMAVDQLHGSREIRLHSMFSVQNNTRKLVRFCVARPGFIPSHGPSNIAAEVNVTAAREIVSVAPGESWQVPAHLCYHDSSLLVKLTGQSQGGADALSSALDDCWCLVARTLSGFIHTGSWGNPKLLRAAVISLPDVTGQGTVMFVRPQAPKQVQRSSGFFSSDSESKSSSNSSFVPLKFPCGDLIRYGPDGDELSPNYITSTPLANSKSFISDRRHRAGSSSNTPIDPRPISLVFQPAVQLCNLVCQPLMYRLTAVSPVKSKSTGVRGKNASAQVHAEPSMAIAEGTLIPADMCDIYDIAALHHRDIYISVRLLNYGWSSAALLYAAGSTFPEEETRHELLCCSLYLQTPNGDDVVLPTVKITVTAVENLLKFTSAAWITNKTGLPLDICDSSSVSFSKNKPHSTYYPTCYDSTSTSRSIESILTIEGSSSSSYASSDTWKSNKMGHHSYGGDDDDSRFRIRRRSHAAVKKSKSNSIGFASAAGNGSYYVGTDSSGGEDSDSTLDFGSNDTKQPPATNVNGGKEDSSRSRSRSRSMRIIKLELYLSSNHFESVEVLASPDWTVAEAFQHALWSSATSTAGGDFFDAENSHYYTQYKGDGGEASSVSGSVHTFLTKMNNNYVVLPVDRDACSWLWDRSVHTSTGDDDDDDSQSAHSGSGSDRDSSLDSDSETESVNSNDIEELAEAMVAEHRAEEMEEKRRIMEALREFELAEAKAEANVEANVEARGDGASDNGDVDESVAPVNELEPADPVPNVGAHHCEDSRDDGIVGDDDDDDEAEAAALRAEVEEEKKRIMKALEELEEQEDEDRSDGEDEGFGEEDVGRVVDDETAAEERLTRFLLAANKRKQREEKEVGAAATTFVAAVTDAPVAPASGEKVLVRRKSFLGSLFNGSDSGTSNVEPLNAAAGSAASSSSRRPSFTRRLTTGSLFGNVDDGDRTVNPSANSSATGTPDPAVIAGVDHSGTGGATRRMSFTRRLSAGSLFGRVEEDPVPQHVVPDLSLPVVRENDDAAAENKECDDQQPIVEPTNDEDAVRGDNEKVRVEDDDDHTQSQRRASVLNGNADSVADVEGDSSHSLRGDKETEKRPSLTRRLSLTASSLFGIAKDEFASSNGTATTAGTANSSGILNANLSDHFPHSHVHQRRASAPSISSMHASSDGRMTTRKFRSGSVSSTASGGAVRRASISLASTSIFKSDDPAKHKGKSGKGNQMRRNWDYGFLTGCQLSPINLSVLVGELGDVVSLRLCHVVEFHMYKQVTNFKSDFVAADNALSRMLNKQRLVYKTALVTLPCTRDCIPFGPPALTLATSSGKSSGTSSGVSVRIGNSFSAWSSSFKPFTFEFGRRLVPEHIQLVLGGLAPANVSGKVSVDSLPKVELGVHVSRNETSSRSSRLLRDCVSLALVPRFLLVSTLPFGINIRQFLGTKMLGEKQTGAVLKLFPGTTESFNFESYDVDGGSRCLQISRPPVPGSGAAKLWSGEIAIDTIGISHAKLRDPICIIKVQVDVVGASFVATFSQQSKAWPPVRIDNLTSFDIQYKQLLPANKSSGAPHDDDGKMLWDPLSCHSSTAYVYDYPTSGSRAMCIGFVPQSRYKTAGNVYHAGMILTDMILENETTVKKSGSRSQPNHSIASNTSQRGGGIADKHKFSSFPAPDQMSGVEKFVTLYGKTPRVTNPVLTGCLKCDLSPFDTYSDGNETDTFGTEVSSLLASDVDPVYISPHSAFRSRTSTSAQHQSVRSSGRPTNSNAAKEALQALRIGASEPDMMQQYHCVLKADVIYIYAHDQQYCSGSTEYQQGAPMVLKGIVQLLGSKSNMNMQGKNLVSFPVFSVSEYIHADRNLPDEDLQTSMLTKEEATAATNKPRRNSIFQSLKARILSSDEVVTLVSGISDSNQRRRSSDRLRFFSDSNNATNKNLQLPTSMSSISAGVMALNRTDSLYIRCLLFRVCHTLCMFDRVNAHGVRGAHGSTTSDSNYTGNSSGGGGGGKKGFRNMDHYFDHVLSMSVSGNDICTALIVLNEAADEVIAGNILQKLLLMGYIVAAPSCVARLAPIAVDAPPISTVPPIPLTPPPPLPPPVATPSLPLLNSNAELLPSTLPSMSPSISPPVVAVPVPPPVPPQLPPPRVPPSVPSVRKPHMFDPDPPPVPLAPAPSVLPPPSAIASRSQSFDSISEIASDSGGAPAPLLMSDSNEAAADHLFESSFFFLPPPLHSGPPPIPVQRRNRRAAASASAGHSPTVAGATSTATPPPRGTPAGRDTPLQCFANDSDSDVGHDKFFLHISYGSSSEIDGCTGICKPMRRGSSGSGFEGDKCEKQRPQNDGENSADSMSFTLQFESKDHRDNWLYYCQQSVEMTWLKRFLVEHRISTGLNPSSHSTVPFHLDCLKVQIKLRCFTDGPIKVLELTEVPLVDAKDKSKNKDKESAAGSEGNSQSKIESGTSLRDSSTGLLSPVVADGRVQVSIKLKSLTLSVIDDMSALHQRVRSSTQSAATSPTEELLFLRLDRLGLDILREVQHLSMQIAVQSIQMDNMCMRPEYPVVLHPRYVISQEQSRPADVDMPQQLESEWGGGQNHKQEQDSGNQGHGGLQKEFPTLHIQFVKKFSNKSVWLLGTGPSVGTAMSRDGVNQPGRALNETRPIISGRDIAIGTPMVTPATAKRCSTPIQPTLGPNAAFTVASKSTSINTASSTVDDEDSSEEDRLLFFESFSCWLAPMALNLSEELVIRLWRMVNSLGDGVDGEFSGDSTATPLAAAVGTREGVAVGARSASPLGGSGDAFTQMNTIADLHLGDVNALYYQALNATTIVYSLHNAIAKYGSRRSGPKNTAEQARLLAQSERLLKHLMKYSSHEVRATLSSAAVMRSNRIVYVGSLRIHPVDIICSFKPTVGFRSTISELKFLYLLDQIGGREHSRVCLNPFITANSFGSVEVYENVIGRHYKNSLFLQFPKLFANNNDFLQGSGLNLVANLGSGVYDLFYEPLEGLLQEGEGTFVSGLGRGSKSLISKTLAGTSGFTSAITGTIGTGVSLMTFDSEFQRERASRRLHHLKSAAAEADNFSTSPTKGRGAGGLGAGIAVGASELGSSVVDGLAGIVMAPYAGFMEAGAAGFGLGLAKGLLGAALKPAVGVLDLASRTAEGMMNSTASSSSGSSSVSNAAAGTGAASVSTTMTDAPVQEAMMRYRLPRSFGRMSEFSRYDGFAASAQYIADKLSGFTQNNKCKVVHYYHIPRCSVSSGVGSNASLASDNDDINISGHIGSVKSTGTVTVTPLTEGYVSPSTSNATHDELAQHNLIEPWASFCPTTSLLLLVTADRVMLVSLTAAADRLLRLSNDNCTGVVADSLEGVSLVWSCPGHCVSEIGADAVGNIVLYLSAPLEWSGVGGLNAALAVTNITDAKASVSSNEGENGDKAEAQTAATVTCIAGRSNVNRQMAGLWNTNDYTPTIADGLFAEHVLFHTVLELILGVSAARTQLLYPPGLGLISANIGKKNVGGLKNFLSATTPRLYQLYGNVLYEYSRLNPDSDSSASLAAGGGVKKTTNSDGIIVSAATTTAMDAGALRILSRYTRERYYTDRRVTDRYIRGIFSSTFPPICTDLELKLEEEETGTERLVGGLGLGSDSGIQQRIRSYQQSILSDYYVRRIIPLADIKISGPTGLGGNSGSGSGALSNPKQKYSLTLTHKGAKASGGAMLCLCRKDASPTCKLAPAIQDPFSMIFPDKESVSQWLRGFTEAILHAPVDVLTTEEHMAVLSSAQKTKLESDREAAFVAVPAPAPASTASSAPVPTFSVTNEIKNQEELLPVRRYSQSKDIHSFLAAAENTKAAQQAQQAPKDISSFVAAAAASSAASSAAANAADLMDMDLERFVARNSVLHQLVIPTRKERVDFTRSSNADDNANENAPAADSSMCSSVMDTKMTAKGKIESKSKTANDPELERLKLQLTHTILLSRIELTEAEVQDMNAEEMRI